MSTDQAGAALLDPAGPASLFDLDRPWRLDERVAVRPEPFGALLYHFGTRRLSFLKNTTMLAVVRSLEEHPCGPGRVHGGRRPARQPGRLPARPGRPGRITHDHPAGGLVSTQTLVELFERGLDAPICLTWELTYACNLACVHCLSSSGRRDPGELSTAECQAVIDTLERMQVFYVNIGGGEPTVRPDFWELVDYATAHHVGVKFSTNGVRIDAAVARKLAASDYVDVQISLDGATAEVNDAVRGQGSYAMAIAGHGAPGRGRVRRVQDLRGGDPAECRASWTSSRRWPTGTAPSCGSPGCGRPAGAPTSGTSCTRPPGSSASSTTGCARTASRC